jgi:hypothetical protein
METWRKQNREAAKKSVAAMHTPEAQAKSLAGRRLHAQKRTDVRRRCENLIKEHQLDIDMPSGRSNLKTWEQFERSLRALIDGEVET